MADPSKPTLAHDVGGTSMPSLWPYPYLPPRTMVGRFLSSEVGGEKKRASDVSKYLSTYARVEKIAKSRKKM